MPYTEMDNITLAKLPPYLIGFERELRNTTVARHAESAKIILKLR
jgi:hypothetical protein